MSDPWLSDVLLSPDDDAPRVAWANAHRSDDPARARFVDLGLEIARSRRQGKDAPEKLRSEAGALAKAHDAAWAGPATRLRGWNFRRGFVEEVLATPAQLVEHGDLVWRAQPILDLTLLSADGLPELLRWAGLAQIRLLRIRGQGLDDRAASALGATPFLASLRGLDLDNNNIGPDGFLAIADGLRALKWASFANNRVEDPLGQLLEAPEAGLPDIARKANDRSGPLPWLTDPVFGPNGAPFPEQL